MPSWIKQAECSIGEYIILTLMPYNLQSFRRDHHVNTTRNLVSLQLHLYHSETQVDLQYIWRHTYKISNSWITLFLCRKTQLVSLTMLLAPPSPHALDNRYIVMLLLFISGHVRPSPGPVDTMRSLPTPYDFKNRAGFGLFCMLMSEVYFQK